MPVARRTVRAVCGPRAGGAPPRGRGPGRGAEADDAVADLGVVDLGPDHLDAVVGELRAAAGTQFCGVEAVMAEHAMHLPCGVVARLRAVEHHDAAARTAEHERRVEAGRAGADDDAVPRPALRPPVHRLTERRWRARGRPRARASPRLRARTP